MRVTRPPCACAELTAPLGGVPREAQAEHAAALFVFHKPSWRRAATNLEAQPPDPSAKRRHAPRSPAPRQALCPKRFSSGRPALATKSHRNQLQSLSAKRPLTDWHGQPQNPQQGGLKQPGKEMPSKPTQLAQSGKGAAVGQQHPPRRCWVSLYGSSTAGSGRTGGTGGTWQLPSPLG